MAGFDVKIKPTFSTRALNIFDIAAARRLFAVKNPMTLGLQNSKRLEEDHSKHPEQKPVSLEELQDPEAQDYRADSSGIWGASRSIQIIHSSINILNNSIILVYIHTISHRHASGYATGIRARSRHFAFSTHNYTKIIQKALSGIKDPG